MFYVLFVNADTTSEGGRQRFLEARIQLLHCYSCGQWWIKYRRTMLVRRFSIRLLRKKYRVLLESCDNHEHFPFFQLGEFPCPIFSMNLILREACNNHGHFPFYRYVNFSVPFSVLSKKFVFLRHQTEMVENLARTISPTR